MFARGSHTNSTLEYTPKKSNFLSQHLLDQHSVFNFFQYDTNWRWGWGWAGGGGGTHRLCACVCVRACLSVCVCARARTCSRLYKYLTRNLKFAVDVRQIDSFT